MMGRVSESLASQFLHSDLEFDCPVCRYPVWVTWAEVVVQLTVRCPCCRAAIRLADADGSMQSAGRVIEEQINQMLKGL